ncbi:MAG TPA: cytochrome c biogenesis protein CcdA [Streptosporangiaceae bacterium]
MSGGLEHLILSGPVLLAMPVAAAAGAITFLSPCCLPLVPGYLAYLTGMSGATADGPSAEQAAEPARALSPAAAAAGASAGAAVLAASQPAAAASPAAIPASPAIPVRSRVMAGTLLFILGFSALYAVEGAAVGSLGYFLSQHTAGLTQILGAVVIVLGVLFLGLFDRFSFAGRIIKPGARPRAGLAGAPLLGMLFGIGWTPCSGPTLSAVLTLAGTTGTAFRGGLLAFVYALGIGVPFLIVAFAFNRGVNVFGFARRHARLITRIGGLMLIAVGLLEVTGAWAAAISWLQVHWLNTYTAPI